jgi:hypothetical protein
VDERLRLRHLATESLDDRLVAEADPSVGVVAPRTRISSTETPASTAARGLGRRRAVGTELARLGDRQVVAAGRPRRPAPRTGDEVVGERVVVVDDEDAHASSVPMPEGKA